MRPPPSLPAGATTAVLVASVASVALVALAPTVTACGGGAPASAGKTSTGARASCATDSDCTVASQSGCCPACPTAPFAIPTLAFEQQKNRCAVVECSAPPAGVQCPRVESPDGWTARCTDGTCSAARK